MSQIQTFSQFQGEWHDQNQLTLCWQLLAEDLFIKKKQMEITLLTVSNSL